MGSVLGLTLFYGVGDHSPHSGSRSVGSHGIGILGRERAFKLFTTYFKQYAATRSLCSSNGQSLEKPSESRTLASFTSRYSGTDDACQLAYDELQSA